MGYKLVCEKCGSEDILVMKWVNPNTNEISSMEAGTEGLCNCCNNCRNTCYLMDLDDWLRHKNEINNE